MTEGVPDNTNLDSGELVPGAVPVEMTLARSKVNSRPGHSHDPEFVSAFNAAWDSKSDTPSSSALSFSGSEDKDADMGQQRATDRR